MGMIHNVVVYKGKIVQQFYSDGSVEGLTVCTPHRLTGEQYE